MTDTVLSAEGTRVNETEEVTFSYEGRQTINKSNEYFIVVW